MEGYSSEPTLRTSGLDDYREDLELAAIQLQDLGIAQLSEEGLLPAGLVLSEGVSQKGNTYFTLQEPEP